MHNEKKKGTRGVECQVLREKMGERGTEEYVGRRPTFGASDEWTSFLSLTRDPSLVGLSTRV